MVTRVVVYSTPEERLASLQKVTQKNVTRGKDISLPEPYARRNSTLEKDILAQVKTVCRERFDWHVRIDVQGKITWGPNGGYLVPTQMTGMPDVIALRDKVLWGIEVKAPGGKISTAQFGNLQAMHIAGAICCIVVNAEKFFRDEVTAVMGGWLRVY